MELSGTVVHIGEIQHIGESFVKQEIVLEYAENPTYPEQIVFEFHQDKVNLLNETVEGEEVMISYNLRGREWANAPKEKGRKWFNTLVGWRLNVTKSQPLSNSTPSYNPPPQQDPGEEDDLPF